jgi:hypothetical protein
MSCNNETLSVPAETPGPERSLEDLEVIISRGLASYEPAAFALLELHTRKLYKKCETGHANALPQPLARLV